MMEKQENQHSHSVGDVEGSVTESYQAFWLVDTKHEELLLANDNHSSLLWYHYLRQGNNINIIDILNCIYEPISSFINVCTLENFFIWTSAYPNLINFPILTWKSIKTVTFVKGPMNLFPKGRRNEYGLNVRLMNVFSEIDSLFRCKYL